MNAKYIPILFPIIFLTLFINCYKKESIDLPEVNFEIDGSVTVSNLYKVNQIEIYNSNSEVQAVFNTFGDSTCNITFNWQINSTYKLKTDTDITVSFNTPEERDIYSVTIHAPFGQKQFRRSYGNSIFNNDSIDLYLSTDINEKIDILIEVEQLLDNDNLTKISYTLDSSNETFSLTPKRRISRDSLKYQFDKSIKQFHLTVIDTSSPIPYSIILKSQKKSLLINFHYRSRSINDSSITCLSWPLPTDINGIRSDRYVKNQISMPDPVWVAITRFLNIPIEDVDYYEPYSWHTLLLQNQNIDTVSVMVQCEIVDPKTDKHIKWFDYPETASTGNREIVSGFTKIPPQDIARSVLPLYVDPDTPEGEYKRVGKVKLLGTSRVLEKVEEKFIVVRSNTLFSVWMVVIISSSLLWLTFAIVKYRSLVENFGLRILVLLSLLGALQFTLTFLSRLVTSFFYAVLGPFNCLVGGLLNEVVTYLLVTAILFLVPRVGAMTLAGIISYIIGGILFGSFGLTDILFVGSTIAFREFCLLLFGVTSFKHEPNKKMHLIPMMLALGLADAMSTFTSLTLHTVLYRLFFAEWYIVLNVVVTGFFYTCIGVWLGTGLGRNLRKVHI